MAVNRSKALGKSTINIKSEPIQGHIGASKYSNDDWGTIAYFIPRSNIQKQFIEKELQYAGIYFLVGYEGNSEKIYVGQAKKRNNGESFLKRLREHDKSKTEPYRYIWQYIIVVTNKNDAWDDSIASSLERIYYHKIPKQNRLNGNEPRGELEIDYDDKVRQIDAYVSIIGFDIFADKSIDDTKEIQVESITNEYTAVEDLQSGMARIPEIVTPSKVVKAMVNMLPEHIFNPDTKFIDLACKGGEYLRELYERLMESESVVMEYPNIIERSNHILTEQLYGIALSKVSLERTTTKLFGFGYNIRILQNYISLLKGRVVDRVGNKITLQEILNEEYGKDMKFDVIIGNPPYNEDTGGGNENQQSSIPLHCEFVDVALSLKPKHLSYVMPCRWYTENDKYNKRTREQLLNQGLKELHDYPNSEDVFKGVSVIGGICIFRYDSLNNEQADECKVITHNGSEISETKVVFDNSEPFYRYKEMRQIIQKIGKYNEDKLNDRVLTTGPFGFKRADRGSYVKDEYHNIKLLASGKDITYVNISEVSKNSHLVEKYKVCTGYTQETISNVFVLNPNEICTLTYLVVGCFDTAYEAECCKRYIETKFARALIDVTKTKLGTTKDNFKLVPDQDFSSNSAIEWKQSISDIDKQLYAKYGLTAEEIAYIEKTINPTGVSNQSSEANKPKLDIQAYEAAAMNMVLKKS